MTYLLQVSTCWIVFYGIYLLFLRKETFFSINRYYLLGALFTGLLVPYLGALIPANEASVEVYQVMTQFTAVEVAPQANVEEVTTIFTWMSLLWSIYILGGIVVFSRFLFGLNRIFCIYKEADKTTHPNYTLVESDKYHLPFSFFHFIFISKQLPLNEEIEKVLQHEELHANQWHSIDIVFTELLQVFFWFNPILIFYKNALRQSHEYLADAYVTQDHNKNSYGQLLLQQSSSGLEIALANQFFHSQIKKRITMMYKEKSKRSAMVKYLAAVPVLLVMLIIFSSNQLGDSYNKEELRKEFATLYESVAYEEGSSLDNTVKWDNLLNKYASEENIELVSGDFKAVASEFGIFLIVGEQEGNRPYTFSHFMYVLPAEKLDQFRNDQEVRDTYQGMLKNFSILFDRHVDFDIKVEADGTYSFPFTYKKTDDISAYFISIHNEGRSVRLELDPNAPTEDINTLLSCASKNNIGIILNLPIEDDGNQTITVLSNGAFMQDGTPLTDEEVLHVISQVEDDGYLMIKAIKGAESNRINSLMKLAADKGVKTTLETTKFKTNNFEETLKRGVIEPADKESKGSIFFNMDGMTDATKEKNLHNEFIKEYNYGEKENTIPGIKVNQNTPNPWRQTTTIKVNTEKTKIAVLSIYNVPGEVVYSKTVQLEKGDNFLQINRKDVGNKYGVYYYQLTVGDKNQTMKMVLIDGEEEPVFKVVEEMPRFPGCEDMDGNAREKEECAKQKMLEFIYSNLKYPEIARDASVEGMCIVQFVIEKDGSVKTPKIIKDIGADCGIESLKVVNGFPTWIPGKQKGKTVRVQYTLPVKFKLESETKKEDSNPVQIQAYGAPNEALKKTNMQHGKASPQLMDPSVYKVVEKMPQFVGCEDIIGEDGQMGCSKCAQGKMLEFIYTNLKYPKEAREKGIDGMVVIQFIVNVDGTLSDFNIVRNPGGGTGEEAKRVVEMMPTWVPGEQGGKKVKVAYTLPVKFKLSGDEKVEKKKSIGFKIQQSKFRGMTNIHQLIKNMPEFNGLSIKSFDIVFVRPKSDVYIFHNKEGEFNDETIEKVKELKEGDRVFIEKVIYINTANEEVESAGVFYTVVADKIETLLEGKTTGVDITKEGFDSNIVLKSTNYDGPQPLFVIDGKIKQEESVENIAPDDIETINVLKGEKAIEKYGEKGQNGVLEITMKIKKSPIKYLIDGQLFDYDIYKTIEKSHIQKEEPASKEDKFMRGINGKLINVNMLSGYGFNSAYFPGTNTEEGSDKALLEYVGNNITYPKTAIDNNIEGLVTVRYTVEADGSLTNFKIGRSLGWGLDEAVLDMMETLAEEKGPWKAAYLDRRPVVSSMVLPVKFKLQSDQKKESISRKLKPVKFAVSPNPSDGKFNVEYQLDKNIPASLIFYSIEGKVLKKMLNLPAENNITVDLSSQYTSAIYISLEQEGKVKTIKATVQK